MVTKDFYSKSYEIKQAIAVLGSQVSLASFLAAVEADVAAKLPYTCPRCKGQGRLSAGPVIDPTDCFECWGEGFTETQKEAVVTYPAPDPQPLVP